MVILKRNDQDFVKLTNKGVFQDDNQASIQKFITDGNWLDENLNLDSLGKITVFLLA